MNTLQETFPEKGHDHQKCMSNVMDYAEELCAQRKLRFTKQRRSILEVIAASHTAIGAYDIIEKLAGSGKRIAPISVYRALDFLMENGLVHRLATLNAYVACAHGEHGYSPQFLICDDCGEVGEIDDVDVGRNVAAVAAQHDFTTRQTVVEINGICRNCKEIKE